MDSQIEARANTKTRILDAAERLFAHNGFQRTTIKHLASGAGANQAAVNYYFGSKMGLIKKVIERRLGAVNQLRMAELEAVRQACAQENRRPPARDVLRAFIEPAFRVSASPNEKKCLLALAGRALWDSDTAIRDIFIHQVDRPFKLLFKIMCEALPELPEGVLLWRLHFATGAMTHCLGLTSADITAPGLSMPKGGVGETTELLLDFITTGVCSSHLK